MFRSLFRRLIVRYALVVPDQPPAWFDDEAAALDALEDEREDCDGAQLQRVVLLPISRRIIN